MAALGDIIRRTLTPAALPVRFNGEVIDAKQAGDLGADLRRTVFWQGHTKFGKSANAEPDNRATGGAKAFAKQKGRYGAKSIFCRAAPVALLWVHGGNAGHDYELDFRYHEDANYHIGAQTLNQFAVRISTTRVTGVAVCQAVTFHAYGFADAGDVLECFREDGRTWRAH